MEILKIVEALQSCSEDTVSYKLDGVFANAVTEAVALLIGQGERIADLENELRDERHRHDRYVDFELAQAEELRDTENRLVQQRLRAQRAEQFICQLCSECEWEDNGELTVMTMKCCSMFPECGKFKLKEQLRWIPVTERLPDSNKSVLVRCTNTTISGGYVTHIGSCDSGKFWFLRTQPGTASFPVREWQVTHWMPLPEPPKEG